MWTGRQGVEGQGVDPEAGQAGAGLAVGVSGFLLGLQAAERRAAGRKDGRWRTDGHLGKRAGPEQNVAVRVSRKRGA